MGISNKKHPQSPVCERWGSACIFSHCKNGSKVSVDINAEPKLIKIRWWGYLRSWGGGRWLFWWRRIGKLTGLNVVTLSSIWWAYSSSKKHYRNVGSYRKADLYMFTRRQAAGLELVRMMDTLLFRGSSVNFHNTLWSRKRKTKSKTSSSVSYNKIHR